MHSNSMHQEAIIAVSRSFQTCLACVADVDATGQNKIPTVGKFLQNLDRDKKGKSAVPKSTSFVTGALTTADRDARIDQELKQSKVTQSADSGDAVPHTATSTVKGAKPVTDPVTGRTVEVK